MEYIKHTHLERAMYMLAIFLLGATVGWKSSGQFRQAHEQTARTAAYNAKYEYYHALADSIVAEGILRMRGVKSGCGR